MLHCVGQWLSLLPGSEAPLSGSALRERGLDWAFLDWEVGLETWFSSSCEAGPVSLGSAAPPIV